ncbi:MAG: hypothetical protein QOG23_2921 [Blastocatellia bacterium]|jgi:hypothetical protein|nr:hypothetical protein [Blastocatellia bacterium]
MGTTAAPAVKRFQAGLTLEKGTLSRNHGGIIVAQTIQDLTQHYANDSVAVQPESLGAYSQRIPYAMPTSNSSPPTVKLERRVASIEDRLRRIEERLLPVTWKQAAGIIGGTLSAMTIVVAFYVYQHVPTLISASVGPLGTRIGTLEKQTADGNFANKQIEDLKVELNESIESVRKSLDDKIDSSATQVNVRLDNYMNNVVKDPKRVRRGYAHAVSVDPTKLSRSLPVARELLSRARQQETILPSKEIQSLGRLSLRLLEKNYKDRALVGEAWETVLELASYKSFVDGKLFPLSGMNDNGCRGVADLGGMPLENKVFEGCRIHYLGGDIILRNVRFIDTEFDLKDEPAARAFVSRLLLSEKLTVSLDTSSGRNDKPSS